MTSLSRQDVIEICGRLDDRLIAEIIATKATLAELMEARTWLASNEHLGKTGHTLTGRVAQLVELLRQEDSEWENGQR